MLVLAFETFAFVQIVLLYFEFSSSVLRMKNVTYLFPSYATRAYYTGGVGRSWSMSCGFTF